MISKTDRVREVNIYPIKSFHAATVEGSHPYGLQVGPTGFEANGVLDREYFLYDVEESTAVTQRGWKKASKTREYRDDSKLATVHVDIQIGYMAIQAGQYGYLEIDTDIPGSNPQSVDLLGNSLAALDKGDEVADFFSRMLGREIRLMQVDHSDPRYLPTQYQRAGASNRVAAADGMPFLLISQASLDYQHELNGIEPRTIPINRYRGNIVIDGTGIGPFAEDYIDYLRIGNFGAWAVKACARCPIPNIDQETGEFKPPKPAVLKGRAGRIPGETQTGVFFGQNLNHIWLSRQLTTIEVGQTVEIISENSVPNVEIRNSAQS